METELKEFSHKRFNPLTGEWVLVSPHRSKRPWQGQQEETNTETRPSHDPSCYLCAGNTRANGEKNPDYKETFVFVNDFSALQENTPSFKLEEGLFKAESESGICKVVCFSPDHSKSLADMEITAIEKVVKLWQQEFRDLGSNPKINYVQIFENKGSIMGCSNPHPHGQIWSQNTLPNEVVKKDNNQKTYFASKGVSLLTDYLNQELRENERIIYQNENFVILIPFWAVWPYETMIIPKNHQVDILSLDSKQTTDFAHAISVITGKYDRLFNTSFPYSSGIHQAPTNGLNNDHWHWHMSFYPPLLRSATVKKFMVGYEMFASPQRDITAESAAAILKDL